MPSAAHNSINASLLITLPVVSFTVSKNNLVVSLDCSDSYGTSSQIVLSSWDFGDGGSATGVYPTHTYAAAGTYTITYTALQQDGGTDSTSQSVTVTAANLAPNATFSATVSGLTVAFNGTGSTDSDGSIAAYAWNYGDSATGSGATPSHTYATAGTYTVALTVTDNSGATDGATRTVSPVTSGGSTGTHVWDTSDASAGFPSGLNYVNYTDATYGYKSGDSFAQTLTRAATKYNGNFILLLPNGFDVTIRDFAQATSRQTATYQGSSYYVDYGLGFYNRYLQGLLCVDGPDQARIKQAPNSLTAQQVSDLNAQAHGTTQVVMGRIGYSAPVYVGGVTFEGSDQGVNKLQGLSSAYAGTGSIWQYCRILGGGVSTDTSPPEETFAWQENHSTNMTFRNCEIDGRLRTDSSATGTSGFTNPTMGTRTSGMFGANGATNISLTNCYLHDSQKSSLTFSYAGTNYDAVGQPNSPTTDVTTSYVHVAFNDFHTSSGFPGINHEAVMGTVVHDHPTIEMDPAGFGSAWNNGHINWCGTSETTGTLRVVEPTWTGGAQNASGFFAVRTYGWYTGSDTGYKNMSQPVIIKNGVTLQPWVRTSSTTPPNGVSPSTHFAWNKG